ncbi:hypothetical protein BJ138DRAFT_1154366 [Hygrophoropsis aurantiaca]|uniref:Uncharacterized protein n=1 Tax=Hygrophoropsis aurantiaca TaxID=72124 RepID=A0ACB8A9P4_9AGAM|nr:hypothetical protein BJ138DRAFT_1154366 [Hygrophoropsis aurantiaca]
MLHPLLMAATLLHPFSRPAFHLPQPLADVFSSRRRIPGISDLFVCLISERYGMPPDNRMRLRIGGIRLAEKHTLAMSKVKARKMDEASLWVRGNSGNLP